MRIPKKKELLPYFEIKMLLYGIN